MERSVKNGRLVPLRFIFILIDLLLITCLHVGEGSGRFENYYPSNADHRTLHRPKPPRVRYLEEQEVSLKDKYTDGICKTLVEPNGYPCQEYTVVTEDGFKLAVQQISHGSGGTPVFLQHGLMAGGETFLFNGPSESYGYILVDLGFDVWIGNTRCVDWSHGHVNLTPSDTAYWDWSWDEMAKYDIPAILEFVYSKNPQKIFYVGHSMGTTMLLAALIGQATQLTAIVRGAVLICPVALLNSVPSTLDRVAADLYLDQVFQAFGPTEFDLQSPVLNDLIDAVCAIPKIDCQQLLSKIAGPTCCVDSDRIPSYLEYYPQPSSTRTIAQYAQVLRRQKFAKYDFGLNQNLVRYHQTTPPAYDISAFPASVPLLMISGSQDYLADPGDVAFLTEQLGQSVQGSIILSNYSHIDFPLSRTANVDFWPKVTSWFHSFIDS